MRQECRTAIRKARCGGSTDRGVAFAIAETERLPTPPAQRRAYLPTSDHFISPCRNVGHKHALLAKGKFVDAVPRELLLADVVVPAVGWLFFPGGIVAALVVTSLPRVVQVECKPLGVLFRHADLQRIKVGVLVVA